MDHPEELQLDCQELRSFLTSAVRPNVRQLLAAELTKMEAAFSAKQNQPAAQDEAPSSAVKAQTDKKPVVFTTKLTSYGWDQTSNAVKMYISLAGVENLAKESVVVDYGTDSVNLFVSNLNGKNHTLNLKNLLHEIVPEKSSHKCKSGNVLITLHKAEGKKWEHLTQTMKKKTDVKAPKLDKEEDPSAGIMGMMKQMYEDGDDEMKRTIAKAWSESRNKPPGASLGL